LTLTGKCPEETGKNCLEACCRIAAVWLSYCFYCIKNSGTVVALAIGNKDKAREGFTVNWIDNVLNGHTTALKMQSGRAELLSGNVANSDTPNFKARDIDFKAEFEQRLSGETGGLKMTNTRHLGMDTNMNSQILYRVPQSFKENGNTVEGEAEQAAFTKNAIQYQASIQFLSSKIRGMKLALKGE
jgi:flagellar basal-body rod protein FlgB